MPVLNGVSLEMVSGELVAILGPSGCGKSSLLSLIPGLIVPDSGTVLVGGVPPTASVEGHSIGMVFQDPVLFEWRTAYENVSLPLEIKHGESEFRSRRGELHDRVEAALAKVRLSGFEERYRCLCDGGCGLASGCSQVRTCLQVRKALFPADVAAAPRARMTCYTYPC